MKIETIPTIDLLPAGQPDSAGTEAQAGLPGDPFSAVLDQAVAAAGGVILAPEASLQDGEALPGQESAPDRDRARLEQLGLGLSIATAPGIAPEIMAPDVPTPSNTAGSASESPETQYAEAMPEPVFRTGNIASESEQSPGASETAFKTQAFDPVIAVFAVPTGTPAGGAALVEQVYVSQDAAPAGQPAPRYMAEQETCPIEPVVPATEPAPVAVAGFERSSQSLMSALKIVQLQPYAAAAGHMDPVPAGECRQDGGRDFSRIAATEMPLLFLAAERQPALENSELDWLQDNQLMPFRSAQTTAEARAQANQGASGSTHSLGESERFATGLALASAKALSPASFDGEPLPAPDSKGHIGTVVPNPLPRTAVAGTLLNLFGQKTAVGRLQTEIAFAEPDFLLRVAEQMHLQVREGRDLIRIQLRPGVLGRLEIRAESGSSGMVATILTESLGVKNYVEQNLHLLYRSLQDLGLKIDRILVLEESWAHHPAGQYGYQEARSDEQSHDSSRPHSWPGRDAEVPGESSGTVPLLLAALAPYSTFHVVA